MIRVGLGYDLHRLVEGRKLLLGGVKFDFPKGEDGHSDGDVLLHAITDALLGASGLGDIGSYFPPEDEKWKDADSKLLLQKVWNDVRNEGWKIVNNAFGECLLMPQESREKIIPAIADAIIDWHITSNQARTFSLMETLAIAVSDNANTLAGAIRAKLIDDNDEKPKAKPIIDENAGANTYVTLSCANYVMIESESSDALEKAKQDLIKRMMDFDYENQL